MRIKAMATIAKMSFLESTVYRTYFLLTIFSNAIYMVIMYFLWDAIFAGVDGGIINGMTFKQTFIYLALAGTISSIIVSFTEWNMSHDIQTGNVAVWFVRPISYQSKLMSKAAGDIMTSFIIMFLPSFILVYFLSDGYIKLGVNIPLFLIAFIIAAAINIFIDFLIGILSFFTESVWGISIMKETVVMLLAGAVIPLAFFPEPIRTVLEFLPFQAIYNLPLQILTNTGYSAYDYISKLAIQLFWLIILFLITKLCYKKASRHIIVNGG